MSFFATIRRHHGDLEYDDINQRNLQAQGSSERPTAPASARPPAAGPVIVAGELAVGALRGGYANDNRQAQDALNEKKKAILRSLAIDAGAIADDELSVQQFMSTQLATVTLNARYSDLKKKMARQGLRHLLVTDDYGRLVGLISDRDVMRRNGVFAKQVMTRDPLTTHPSTKIRSALEFMTQRRISCLPVVDNGRLIGIVTTTDLLIAFECTLVFLARKPAHDPSGITT